MEKSPKKTKTWVIKCQGDIDSALQLIEDYIASLPETPNRYTRKLKNKEICNIEQLPCSSKGYKRYVPPENDDNDEDNYYLFSFKGRDTVITKTYFDKIWGDLDIKPAFVYEEKREKGEEDNKEDVSKEDEEIYDVLKKVRKLEEAREKMEKVHEEFNELYREVMPGVIVLLERVSKGREGVNSTELWSYDDVKSEDMKSCSKSDLEENSVLFKAEEKF